MSSLSARNYDVVLVFIPRTVILGDVGYRFLPRLCIRREEVPSYLHMKVPEEVRVELRRGVYLFT